MALLPRIPNFRGSGSASEPCARSPVTTTRTCRPNYSSIRERRFSSMRLTVILSYPLLCPSAPGAPEPRMPL